MQPLVTVITPTYNCARFIEETIKSVLSQDYPHIEYIVIDDGSTDDTMSVLQPYINRIALRIHQGNFGEQETVNEALQLASGGYFMVVNADDPLLPGAVSRLVKCIVSNHDLLCAYPDFASIDEASNVRVHLKRHEYDFTYMVRHHTCLPSVGSLFNSSVIETVGLRDTSLAWLGDFDYWLRIGLRGRMAHVPATLATWRVRNGQMSGKKSDARALEHIKVIEKFYSLPNVPPEILKVKNEAICWSLLVAATVAKSKSLTAKCLLRALRTYPRQLTKIETYDIAVKRAIEYLRR